MKKLLFILMLFAVPCRALSSDFAMEYTFLSIFTANSDTARWTTYPYPMDSNFGILQGDTSGWSDQRESGTSYSSASPNVDIYLNPTSGAGDTLVRIVPPKLNVTCFWDTVSYYGSARYYQTVRRQVTMRTVAKAFRAVLSDSDVVAARVTGPSDVFAYSFADFDTLYPLAVDDSLRLFMGVSVFEDYYIDAPDWSTRIRLDSVHVEFTNWEVWARPGDDTTSSDSVNIGSDSVWSDTTTIVYKNYSWGGSGGGGGGGGGGGNPAPSPYWGAKTDSTAMLISFVPETGDSIAVYSPSIGAYLDTSGLPTGTKVAYPDSLWDSTLFRFPPDYENVLIVINGDSINSETFTLGTILSGGDGVKGIIPKSANHGVILKVQGK